MKSNFKTAIQTFGRSLLLPIGIMAPVGMIMGLMGAFTQGYMIETFPILDNETLQTILRSAQQISSVIFSNIPILFAMGVAYGMSKHEKGIAVFSSIISYLTLLMVMNVYLTVTGTMAEPDVMAEVGQATVLGIQTIRIDVAGGIIAGLLAAYVTDRFYRLRLPLAFAFFSGKKSVLILTFLYTIPIGLVLPFIWGLFTSALIFISPILMNEPFGPGIYWLLNRALIPLGLHHVLASVVRFTEAGGIYVIEGVQQVGILNAMNQVLFDLGPSHESWNRIMPTISPYLAGGQMLTTLFRVPAIGLAMYHTAFAKNKTIAKGVILTIVLTAFLGNITEPLEFSFMFISPLLYLLYIILVGITTIPLGIWDISIGYIRGTIFDFGIFGLLYENTGWFNLIIIGILNFIVFYFVFKYVIKRFNITTPGREEENRDVTLLNEKKYDRIAELVIESLGGRANIVNVDNCVSRLRIDLKDQDKFNDKLIKESGSSGFFFPKKKHIHIVFGPHVEFVRNEIDDLLKK
ncbi:PTS system, maltose and glucose-specific IIC component [Amphibacillus marinus]|uniref:PTS system, maltose and glucose-specific IIC component n=1 Tax=Amphibacillus marinus TaxID=872970 RepID=A0A1H8QGZ0_9BACI|nr:PTS transporter subunit EIIC [Amphibacillus marinus]SEO53271.1 PTS system, maltose and glucose-specific IIC component [Amphibacillus marinus]